MKYTLKPASVAERIQNTLSHYFGVSPAAATNEQFYKAVSIIIRDLLAAGYSAQQKNRDTGGKQIYYLCMEFLMGRSLKNHLYNLGLAETFATALDKFDIKLEWLYEEEPDAGLGNGGLGRLAACYLDALASQGYQAMGYSIRYEYGIFRQKIVDGWQTELPDFWLPGGEVWLIPQEDATLEVRFEGEIEESWDGQYHHITHQHYNSVYAVPYNMMVSGLDGKAVCILRLWASRAPGLDMHLFNQGDYLRAIEQESMAEVISKVLYPADNHPEGKSLRLRQQYFLVSASIQDIIRRHLAKFDTPDDLPERIAIHINDTHPTMAVPELMRILLDDCGYGWEQAWDLVTRTVAYTNHTVMHEALECWPEDLFKRLLPRIWQITTEIDHRFRAWVWEKTQDAAKVERMAIISSGIIRMANLCAAVCHTVNGVSALHSDILKNTVFHDFYSLMPDKFTNVTNGIAHRRWLAQANPALTKLLTEHIGAKFLQDASELQKFLKYREDAGVLSALQEVKLHNKKRLAEYMERQQGIKVDPTSLFDVQVKRLHEYKRQHLNALHILADYLYLKDNPNADFVPRTYIFAAKAAPGYFMAKKIIEMICTLAEVIDQDAGIGGRMKVVFLENYNVTLAELLMPAAEISEQISLAGTEASGTGNMKLMLSGAVTLGTLDGANVEIHEAVGDENMFLFGMTAGEVANLMNTGYNPGNYYLNNSFLKRVIDTLELGIGGKTFREITSSLIHSDPYMVMADFDDYCRVQHIAGEVWRDSNRFNQMSLVNIASAGRFSADRAVAEYAQRIWHAKD